MAIFESYFDSLEGYVECYQLHEMGTDCSGSLETDTGGLDTNFASLGSEHGVPLDWVDLCSDGSTGMMDAGLPFDHGATDAGPVSFGDAEHAHDFSGGGDHFWSSNFSAGNCNADNTCGYVNVPGYGVMGYGGGDSPS